MKQFFLYVAFSITISIAQAAQPVMPKECRGNFLGRPLSVTFRLMSSDEIKILSEKTHIFVKGKVLAKYIWADTGERLQIQSILDWDGGLVCLPYSGGKILRCGGQYGELLDIGDGTQRKPLWLTFTYNSELNAVEVKQGILNQSPQIEVPGFVCDI